MFLLALRCIKTKESYCSQFQKQSSVENSQFGLLRQMVNRGSKRDRRKRLSTNRFSFIEPTSTSRYRAFTESAIREYGLIGIFKRIIDITHSCLWKARSTLEVQVRSFLVERLKYDHHEFGDFYDYYLNLGQHFKGVNNQSLFPPNFMTEDFGDNSMLKKATIDMGLPPYLDLYLFLLKAQFDVVHECLRFRLDCKPKVEPSPMSIRQVSSIVLSCTSGSFMRKFECRS